MASAIFLSLGLERIDGDVSIDGELSLTEAIYIGTDAAPVATPEVGVTVYADKPMQAWSHYANGIDLFTSSTSGFRAPTLYHWRNNSDSHDVHGAVTSGQDLGYHYFGGHNGVEYVEANYMRSRATENWDATHRGSNWQFLATPNGTTTPSTAIGIYTNTSTGNTIAVGIGTNTAPESALGLGTGQALSWLSSGFLSNLADGVWRFTNHAGYPATVQHGTETLVGYVNGSHSTSSPLQSVTTAVALSGASVNTGAVIPAGATVEAVATSTSTAITGATGYQIGDGVDADRYGDISGTPVGTASGSNSYTADPRWWDSSARAVTLTAKGSNFTGGVVQVTVFYRTAAGV